MSHLALEIHPYLREGLLPVALHITKISKAKMTRTFMADKPNMGMTQESLLSTNPGGPGSVKTLFVRQSSPSLPNMHGICLDPLSLSDGENGCSKPTEGWRYVFISSMNRSWAGEEPLFLLVMGPNDDDAIFNYFLRPLACRRGFPELQCYQLSNYHHSHL